MKLKFALLAGIPALTAACGGSAGSFDGSVNGTSLSVKDAIVFQVKDQDGKVTAANVVLSDVSDLCSMMKANKAARNATMVTFTVNVVGADGQETAPVAGDYSVQTDTGAKGNHAGGLFMKSDANCDSVGDFETLLQKQATLSGKLTVDEVDLKEGGSMSGSFDMVFGTQADKVTGSFDATYCEFPETAADPTCE